MDDTLQQMTTEALKAELQRREKAEEDERTRALERQQKAVVDNVEAFLAVVPEHSRTSCSDAYPSNADRSCTRCCLIMARETLCFPYEIEVRASPVNVGRL